MRRARLVACLLLAGCAASESDVGAGSAPIVGGMPEPGRPEVVYVFRRDGAACTGAIIAPRVVLTADHCVAGAPASSFRVYIGSSTREFTAEHAVRAVRRLPNGGLDSGANDVAALVLAVPAEVPPLGIARVPPDRLVGSEVTAVGYGLTPAGRSGTKYTTTARVEEVDAGFIFVEPAVCSGDSGGPLIGDDGLVYGVASFIYAPDGMSEPRCGTAPGAYNEIYAHLAFLDAVFDETGDCVASEEVCNGRDDDCDGSLDEGCTPLGEPCDDDGDCVGGRCADTPAGRVCTQPCDPMQPHEGCGPGLYCAARGCEGFCVRGSAGTLPHAAPCTHDTECASLLCIDPGDGRRRCLTPCRGDAGLCIEGEVCVAGPDACGACMPSELVRGPRGLGEPCETDGDCRAPMVCVEHDGAAVCASECPTSFACRAGFECRGGLCIRDRRQDVGGVCAGNADCLGGVCAAQGERHWCTARCEADEHCPDGFGCVPAGETLVCAPRLALEGERCDVDDDCASGRCAEANGERRCASACSGREPCARGFECRRDADGTAALCLPRATSGGGCSATAGRSTPGAPAFVLVALLALGFARARRR